jgi:hypothetical protein
MQSFP